MSIYYFPGCRIKEGYPLASANLSAYLEAKYGLKPQGCCKDDFTKIQNEDSVVLICNNCQHDLQERTILNKVTYVYELIDNDKDFVFPDYKGKQVYLQHCHHGFGSKDITPVICSLLDKMNLKYIAFEDEVEDGMSREVHRQVCKENAKLIEGLDVVTYCAICNLAYKKEGIASHFLLDLLFGTGNL